MALDRRITVTYEGPGGARDMHGEYVPGPTITKSVWATRRDLSAQDVLESGGSRTEILRDWQIRWRKDIAEIQESDLFSSLMVLDNGKLFNVTKVLEETGRDGDFRKRWLRIARGYTHEISLAFWT